MFSDRNIFEKMREMDRRKQHRKCKNQITNRLLQHQGKQEKGKRHPPKKLTLWRRL
jgi:hypothetical protein